MSLPTSTSIYGAAIRSGFAVWMTVVCLALCGCTSILSPISAIPVHRLPPQFLAQPRADWEPIGLARLRQEPPRHYLLDAGDILGIYIEGVLGEPDQPPPVHFPDAESDLPPAIGFPIPVREDGTLALPLVPPIPVRNLTLTQAEELIRRAYTVDQEILQPGQDRIIVTVMQERTVRVIVVRQDGGTAGALPGFRRGVRSDQHSQGFVITLPAYKNDVLHALAETGGLPGINAKNEVKILRGRLADARRRDAFVQAFYAYFSKDPCLCPPPLPDDPTTIRIPLRLPPGQVPTFLPQDIVLEEGDIVYIEARDTEVFYTGGLLGGGEWPLPRDYDLDVLGAMAIAGQGVDGGGQRIGGLIAGMGGVPPGQLIILRRTPCGGQVTFSVDLNRAIQDPRSRPLVQAGDTLILRYKPQEELTNFGMGVFFTYGVRQLLRGR